MASYSRSITSVAGASAPTRASGSARRSAWRGAACVAAASTAVIAVAVGVGVAVTAAPSGAGGPAGDAAQSGAAAGRTPRSLRLPAWPPTRALVETREGSAIRLRMRSVRDGQRLALSPVGGSPADLMGPPARWSLDGDSSAMLGAFFRSAKSGVVPVDGRLVELLGRIYEAVGGREIVLVSGYREPGRGTSRGSFHTSGMAADIAVDGLSPRQLWRVARTAGASGIGLYRGFVHVDVRAEPYVWSRGGALPRSTHHGTGDERE